jgi:hypothetical protein
MVAENNSERGTLMSQHYILFSHIILHYSDPLVRPTQIPITEFTSCPFVSC